MLVNFLKKPLTQFEQKAQHLRNSGTTLKVFFKISRWDALRDLYHLYNLKNVKSTYRVVLLLVTFQGLACNFTKSNTPPRLFFTFMILCKWYQIAQRTTTCTPAFDVVHSCWSISWKNHERSFFISINKLGIIILNMAKI